MDPYNRIELEGVKDDYDQDSSMWGLEDFVKVE